jgi:hypothetical protein
MQDTVMTNATRINRDNAAKRAAEINAAIAPAAEFTIARGPRGEFSAYRTVRYGANRRRLADDIRDAVLRAFPEAEIVGVYPNGGIRVNVTFRI